MKDAITNYINTCNLCQINKYERHPNKVVFRNTPIGENPFEHIYIDTFSVEKQKFLTITDSFSKFSQAYPTTSNSLEILKNLLIFISHYGLPAKITCDQGREFKNVQIENFCKLHKINLHYTTVRNPNSNSPIERFHSTIIESLRILRSEQKQTPIDELMIYALIGYNNSVHTSTTFTPLQIIKANVNYQNPSDYTDEVIFTDYLINHSKNLDFMKQKINVAQTKARDLTKVNENRIDPTEINVENEIFLKSDRRPKITPRYIKDIVVQDNENTVKTNKGTYHKNIIKPKRKTGLGKGTKDINLISGSTSHVSINTSADFSDDTN